MVGFAPQRAANRDSSQTVGARGKCRAAEGAHSVWSKYGCVVGINRAHPQMCWAWSTETTWIVRPRSNWSHSVRLVASAPG